LRQGRQGCKEVYEGRGIVVGKSLREGGHGWKEVYVGNGQGCEEICVGKGTGFDGSLIEKGDRVGRKSVWERRMGRKEVCAGMGYVVVRKLGNNIRL
jgi:hypothetical protein